MGRAGYRTHTGWLSGLCFSWTKRQHGSVAGEMEWELGGWGSIPGSATDVPRDLEQINYSVLLLPSQTWSGLTVSSPRQR